MVENPVAALGALLGVPGNAAASTRSRLAYGMSDELHWQSVVVVAERTAKASGESA